MASNRKKPAQPAAPEAVAVPATASDISGLERFLAKHFDKERQGEESAPHMAVRLLEELMEHRAFRAALPRPGPRGGTKPYRLRPGGKYLEKGEDGKLRRVPPGTVVHMTAAQAASRAGLFDPVGAE